MINIQSKKIAGQASEVALDGYDRKQVLEVDGKPFFFNGIQIRIDKVKDIYNYTDDQIKRLFQIAKQDGFTVANAQIRWKDVQPDQWFGATETTYIKGGDHQSKNFADSDSIQTGFDKDNASSQSLAYMKFDFSRLMDSEVTGAKIRIYVKEDSAQGSVLKVYGIEDDTWDATKITWDNAPNHDGNKIVDAHELAKSPSYDLVNEAYYYDFDVTEFIQSYCMGDQKASFILQSEATENPIRIDGATGVHPPQLILSRQSVYDWSYLDKVIGWAEDAGIKLEILWFGSDTCSLSIDNRVPHYVFHKYQKVLADKANGQDIPEDIPYFRKNKDPMYGVYQYVMCKNDPGLREAESAVVKALFNHIAEYNAKNGNTKTVIGCQLSNEPAVAKMHGGRVKNSKGEINPHCQCDYCQGAFAAAEGDLQTYYDETMWAYNNNLGTAVKESKYSVWTRVNNFKGTDSTGVQYNEWKRSTTGTNIDFIGLDAYNDVPKYLFTFGHAPVTNIDPHFKHNPNYAIGHNLVMNMENGGSGIHYERHGDDGHGIGTPKYVNADRLVLASVAGGGFLNVYDLCSPDDLGLYQNTKGNVPKPVNPDTVERLRNTQFMLNKLAYDLAKKQSDGAGGTKLKFFNSVSDLEESPEPKHITMNIRSFDVEYSTMDNGVGIAVERGEKEIALASTTASDFTLKGLVQYGVKSIRQGAYDADNKWGNDGKAPYEISGEDVIVHMPAYGCVQVLTENVILAADTYLYDAEGLPYSLSTNAKNEIWEDGAHGGHWLKVSPVSEGSLKEGDSITFTVNVLSDTLKYEVVRGYRSGTASGTAQLSIEGKDYGDPIDMYATEAAFKEAFAGVVNFSSAGDKTFKYTVSGKNAKSEDYQLGFDYIKLITVV